MKRILFLAAAITFMFSSCTKEDAYTPSTVNGVEVFTASINVEDGEQTRLELNGKDYLWNAGDGIGIGSLNQPDANVPAYTAESASKPKFVVEENDYRYFGTWGGENTALYAYYPYHPEGKLEKNGEGKVYAKLEIPVEQRYAPESFYKNTVPAVGYVAEYKGAETNIELTVPVALLRLNVKGFGETEGLTLKIKKPGVAEYYNLSGSNDVVISTSYPTTKKAEDLSIFTEPTADSKTVSITFGNLAEDFDYYTPKAMFFVIPAGLELFNAVLELTNGTETKKLAMDANFFPAGYFGTETPSYLTKPNNVTSISSKTFDFGVDGKWVIDGDNNEAALEFITYAYFAQADQPHLSPLPANYNGPTVEDWETLYNEGYNWNTQAILLSNVNLDPVVFDAKAVYDSFATKVNKTARDKVYINALAWYLNNSNAVESFSWGENDIAIVGGLKDPVVINGLTVLGNGITASAKLENLKFTNTTVVATQAAEAGFLVAKAHDATVKNVVLGENNILDATAAEGYVGGIAGIMNAHNSSISGLTVNTLPTVISAQTADSPVKNVGQIFGSINASNNVVLDLEVYKVTSLDMPAVHTASTPDSGPQVIDFKNAPEGATYTDVLAANHIDRPASIVIDGVSYWNGKKHASVGGDRYFTAEELAYRLENETNLNVELTDNIDMQSLPLVFTAFGTRNTILNGKNLEIKNVNAKPNNNAGGVCALFGTNATLSNLVLSGISIDTKGLTNEMNVIAGLATTGIATNVTVNDITVNIDEATPVATTVKSVGGVFAEAGITSINNVEVKSCTINYNGANALKVRTGVLAGTLTVNPDKTNNTLGKFVMSGVNADYNFVNFKVNTQGKLTNPNGVLEYYRNSNDYANKYAFGTVYVANAAFASNGIVKAELKLAEGTKLGWTTKKMAAGVVFADALLDQADKNALYAEEDIESYDYSFKAGAEISHYTVWGFNKN